MPKQKSSLTTLSFSFLMLLLVSGGCAMTSEVSGQEILKRVAELPSKLDANSLALRPDGGHVAAASSLHSKVEVWDVTSSRKITTLEFTTGGSSGDIAYSPDGRYLAGGERTIGIWDAQTYEKIREIVGPYVDPTRPQPIGVPSIAFSPDSRQLAVVYNLAIPGGFAIVLYDFPSGELVRKIEVDGGFAGKLFFTPDGKGLVGGHVDPTAVRAAFKTLSDPTADPAAINRLSDLEIYFWDVESGQRTKVIPKVHLMSITALAMSDNGKLLATGSRTGERRAFWNQKANRSYPAFVDNDPVRLWDAKTGTLVREFVSGISTDGLVFSIDGQHLISCHPGDLLVWNIATGERVQEAPYKTEQGLGGACQLSRDGRLLAIQHFNDVAIYEFTKK